MCPSCQKVNRSFFRDKDKLPNLSFIKQHYKTKHPPIHSHFELSIFFSEFLLEIGRYNNFFFFFLCFDVMLYSKPHGEVDYNNIPDFDKAMTVEQRKQESHEKNTKQARNTFSQQPSPLSQSTLNNVALDFDHELQALVASQAETSPDTASETTTTNNRLIMQSNDDAVICSNPTESSSSTTTTTTTTTNNRMVVDLLSDEDIEYNPVTSCSPTTTTTTTTTNHDEENEENDEKKTVMKTITSPQPIIAPKKEEIEQIAKAQKSRIRDHKLTNLRESKIRRRTNNKESSSTRKSNNNKLDKKSKGRKSKSRRKKKKMNKDENCEDVTVEERPSKKKRGRKKKKMNKDENCEDAIIKERPSKKKRGIKRKKMDQDENCEDVIIKERQSTKKRRISKNVGLIGGRIQQRSRTKQPKLIRVRSHECTLKLTKATVELICDSCDREIEVNAQIYSCDDDEIYCSLSGDYDLCFKCGFSQIIEILTETI